MVVRRYSFSHTPTQEQDNTLSDNRCSRHRLGRSAERYSYERAVVRDPETMALEQKRNASSLRSNKATIAPTSECSHPTRNGQSNSSSIHSEGRTDKISSTVQSNLLTSPINRRSENNSVSMLPSREIQLHSRPLIMWKSPSRMAPASNSNERNIQKMGRPRHRLIRVSKISGSRTLRQSRLQRSVSLLCKRLQSFLEVQTSVGIPSTQSDSKSAGTSQQLPGTIHNNTTTLGANILIDRANQTQYGTAYDNQESRNITNRSDIRPSSTSDRSIEPPSVENWMWETITREWSQQEKDLIKKSWRISTLETYKAPLSR